MNEDDHVMQGNFERDFSPEERLWLAVVEQAVWDSQQIKIAIDRGFMPVGVRSMRSALLSDIEGEWFDTVCQNAGLSTSSIISRIKCIIALKN